MKKTAETNAEPIGKLLATEQLPQTITLTLHLVGPMELVPTIVGANGKVDSTRSFSTCTTWDGGFFVEIEKVRYSAGVRGIIPEFYKQITEPEAPTPEPEKPWHADVDELASLGMMKPYDRAKSEELLKRLKEAGVMSDFDWSRSGDGPEAASRYIKACRARIDAERVRWSNPKE